MASDNLGNVTCVKCTFVWKNHQLFVGPKVLAYYTLTELKIVEITETKLPCKSKIAFYYYRREFGSLEDNL